MEERMKVISHSSLAGVLLAGFVASLIGCGGSNAQSNGFTGGNLRGGIQPMAGDATRGAEPKLEKSLVVPVFVSDVAGGNLEQLWVNILTVRLSTSKDTVNLLDRPEGLWLNLKSLQEGKKGFFFFLGAAGVAPQDVTRLVFEVGPQVAIQKAGEEALELKSLSETHRVDDSRSKLVIPVKGQAAASAFVVDFRTARVRPDGQDRIRLEPVLGSSAGLEDLTRQIPITLNGTVASLSGAAPQINFQLDQGSQRLIRTISDPSTSVFRRDGQAAASLAQGQTLRVVGPYSLVSQSVEARAIEQSPQAPSGLARWIARPKAVDAEKETIVWTPVALEGSKDPLGAFKTSLGADLKALDSTGKSLSKAEVFELASKQSGWWIAEVRVAETGLLLESLQAAPLAEAKPTRLGQTPAAPDVVPAETEWTGAVGDSDPKVMTLTLAGEAEARSQAPSAVRQVQLTDSTKLSNTAGDRLTKDEFFQALAKKPKVKVSGRLDGGILRASTAQIVP